MEKKINVLIVDDSSFMRIFLRNVLESNKNIVVIGTAKNGIEAIEKIKKLQPDIVTLDVEMPEMDGLAVLKQIMNENPVPIIMLSTYTREGADITLKALELGALDFIFKPSRVIDMDIDALKEDLISKIITLTKSKALGLHSPIYRRKSKISFNGEVSKNPKYIIGIGTSTGGPSALKQLLTPFPKNIPASILIVQHIPASFTDSLAQRLNSSCEIEVKVGERGEMIKSGYAYIAPGDYHMTIYKQGGKCKINLNTDEPLYGHRPSVDILFHSIGNLSGKEKIGVIMTGMGRDGSTGLKNISDNGGYTIAQNEETCVVFGMPKAAIEIGAANKILPLQEINYEILNYIQS
ncbi:MAG TPA: chemotaxis response regulator protein-glutamate methylesterase [Thermoanaerobacterales bacterium]|nr:chemotaxis response regulator protein-glutamate methylesterase [Thermoanaerobacterales bacterium]